MLFPPNLACVMTIAIIPVKSFRTGNLRLATALDDTQRLSVGMALASHVAETVVQGGLTPLIVTSDYEVAAWATTAGFTTIPDEGTGLNDAAREGVEWASRTASRWMVIHGDLPLLRPDDIATLTAVESETLAPSSDGGTSAISAARSIEFDYGLASFHRHLIRLDSPTIVARPGLLHDLDSPIDLESVLAHPLGSWLGDHIQ